MSPPVQVPLTVLDDGDPERLEQLMRAVEHVARSGAFIGGAAVAAFEREWAEWCDVPHAVGVSSGTDALALALRALGVGPGDEVIVPANSFIATAEAVSLVGATPRFADVEEATQLVSATAIEAALTAAVRCVIPVHLYGRTVDMEPVMRLARERGLAVLEDCAQAHGARYRGQRVGSIGDAGTFSFYPAKNLGAWGDAGAVVSRDAALIERVRLLRSHGEHPRYHHGVIGTTARLDAVQAAVLSCKLPQLEQANERRREVAGRLRAALAGSDLALPEPPEPGGDHVYHQFVVRARRRGELRSFLAAQGIATGIHYPVPIHRSEAYLALATEVDVAPVASRLAGEVLSLPMFPTLSARQIERIAAAVARFRELSRGPLLAAGTAG
jgi:dTDP-3-amino-3,4,6-trideoxy-alpha-D-glucose transaminase